VQVIDGVTGKHRTTVNVEKAARLTLKRQQYGQPYMQTDPLNARLGSLLGLR
jgi:hypothetical protein